MCNCNIDQFEYGDWIHIDYVGYCDGCGQKFEWERLLVQCDGSNVVGNNLIHSFMLAYPISCISCNGIIAGS